MTVESIVPQNVALVYDGTCWYLQEAPPVWWWDLLDGFEEADALDALPPGTHDTP